MRNARTIERHARVPLMPIVKADAYRLGVVPVVRALEAMDPWGYGVATIGEGEALRQARIDRHVLVTTPIDPRVRDLKAMQAARLTPAFGDAKSIRMWMMTGGGDWHLAIDTGMNRAGIRWDEVGTIADELRACPPAGAFTHFHSSDRDDGSMALQERRFRDALASLPAVPALLHAENSAATARTSPSPWSVVRPGAFLYGIGSGATLEPEPVVHFRTTVVDLHDLRAGDTVSYGAQWVASRPSRIATVAAGYADGYLRSLGNRGTVLVAGRRAHVAGAVTMDMTMVDVTDLPCELGDTVTLIGASGDELITLGDAGASCGLSPYEMLTGLGIRVPRRYL